MIFTATFVVEVGILVTFDSSLLLVTQLADIRYLVFVTLLVTGLSSLQRCSSRPYPVRCRPTASTVHTPHLWVAKPIV